MKKGTLTSRILGIWLVSVMIVATLGGLSGSVHRVEASPAIIYVPDDYSSIQAAVDAAVAGDTIVVHAGTHQEHVTLYKSLVVQTDEGAIIDGGGSLSTVTITAAGCTVSGFNITGSGSHPNENAAIRIDSTSNNISGNTIWGNKGDGILLHGGENVIMNNLISENEGNGLYVDWAYGNTIEGNTISGNGDYGLYLRGDNNILRHNVMSGNGRNFGVDRPYDNDVDTSNTVDGRLVYYLVGVEDALVDSASNAGYVLAIDSQNITVRDLTLANNDRGVYLHGCYDCLVDNVTAQDNDYGIYLQESSYCTAQNCTTAGDNVGIYLSGSIGNLIADNIVQTSDGTGIVLDSSDGNFLTGNIVRDNQSGIGLSGSYDCRIEHNLVAQNEYDGVSIDSGRGHLIYGNTIYQNGYYGITMGGEGNDIHHNNFVDNGENARRWSGEGSNSWDDGSEGNYWSDYKERYPDAEEIDETGIWDTPYEIPYDTGDKDNYPLVEPFDTLIPHQPPNEPGNPSPADDAIGVSINADLSWTGGDPDLGDTVTYDVYFGTNETPPLKQTIGPYPAAQSSMTYDPGPLAGATTYYWKIIATDSHGISTEGPLWDFTTTTIICVPADYPTIQAAVNAASPGNAIIVRAGVYQEQVTLYESVILRSDEGATIDGGGSLSTVTITADGCTVSGFNITGSGSHPNQNAGLRIDSNGNTISGNTIWGNTESGILLNGEENTILNNSIWENGGDGLYVSWGYRNTIEGNTISGNGKYGLYVGWGYGSTIEGNTISGNGGYGLYLRSDNNILRDNVMSGNGRNFGVDDPYHNNVDTSNTIDGKLIYYLVGVEDEVIGSASNAGYVLVIDSQNITIRDLALANNDKGVWLYGCYDCLVDNVTAQDNDYGIYLQGCSYCTVQNCTISGNGQGIYLSSSIGNLITCNIVQTSEDTGIALYSSDGNFLTGNIVRDNQAGIRLGYSYDCRIEHNLVARNEYDGISIDGDGHLIYGNTISQNGNCGVRVWSTGSGDIHHNNFVDNGDNARSWSSEGPNSWDDGAEGNYWSDYGERYPDAEEIDGTGIWNTTYEIPGDGGDKDNYPLVEPVETLVPNQPPMGPGNPSPADDAIGVSASADLDWIGGDPDPADTVTYDIYFGINATPPLEETIGPYPATQSLITYDPGTLAGAMTYYWKIIATDSHGMSAEGPLWNFTTQSSAPSITVTCPNGAENWTVGSTQTITWTSSGVTGDVRIGISRDGGSSWSDFITDTANDGNESWIVTGPATSQARIRVMSASDGGIWDMTDGNFVIDVEVWVVAMVADAGVEGRNANLEFGMYPNATDGYDCGTDLPSPPPEPGVLFEGYFSIIDPLFPGLNKDFRGEIPNVWTLTVKSTDQDIELTWDASGIPSDLWPLMDTGIGKINMKTQDNVVLSPGQYTITISVSEEVEIELSLQAGWNMVSVPLALADNWPSAVFPGVAGIFAWNATSRSYYVPTVIEPEKGYWVAVTENTTITIRGTPIDTWTTDINAGWNMIGSVITVASIVDPNDDPDGSVIPTAYWWNPVSKSYVLTTDIEPGKGYWVAALNDCILTL
ncbi:MAG: right-handed parallel beta-helix repeat-containing protein [Dehalococcoidia bacterium]|nr:right-handed parallel beta-helix repeat-containing protein [Dehalococcoidia bacterium]